MSRFAPGATAELTRSVWPVLLVGKSDSVSKLVNRDRTHTKIMHRLAGLTPVVESKVENHSVDYAILECPTPWCAGLSRQSECGCPDFARRTFPIP